ncbi:hypothetical protein FRC03_009975 [Tulasnella sp. 419]|nr:hypothetical protein FRC03_009975 [Tulasnella sp. 419]
MENKAVYSRTAVEAVRPDGEGVVEPEVKIKRRNEDFHWAHHKTGDESNDLESFECSENACPNCGNEQSNSTGRRNKNGGPRNETSGPPRKRMKREHATSYDQPPYTSPPRDIPKHPQHGGGIPHNHLWQIPSPGGNAPVQPPFGDPLLWQKQQEGANVFGSTGCPCTLCKYGVQELDLGGKIVFEERCNYGGYADIWRGKLMRMRKERAVAIKELRIRHSATSAKAKETEERLNMRFMREVLLWKRLKHPNIVPLLGLTLDAQSSPTLISPWYPHGNVIQYLQSNPEADRTSLASDVASGLTYLHSVPIVHGDLKGENALVDVNYRASLCDFGMSHFIDEANRITGFTTTSAYAGGTDRFLCPELLEDEPKTTATDIWAFACLVVQILTDQIPYANIKGKHALPFAIIRGEPPMTNDEKRIDERLWQCLTKCWDKAPDNRPAAPKLSLELEHLRQMQLNARYANLLHQDACGADPMDSDELSDAPAAKASSPVLISLDGLAVAPLRDVPSHKDVVVDERIEDWYTTTSYIIGGDPYPPTDHDGSTLINGVENWVAPVHVPDNHDFWKTMLIRVVSGPSPEMSWPTPLPPDAFEEAAKTYCHF